MADTPYSTTKTAPQPRIEDLGAHLAGETVQNVIQTISDIPSLEALVLFPDLVYKKDTESPASMASATRGTIVPTLTAPSLGCSMGAIATNLTKRDITPALTRAFYANMQRHLGRDYSIIRNILVWLGFIKRPLLKYDLTHEAFGDVIRRGAEAAVERYGLPKETLEHIEFRGSLFSKDEQETIDIHEILPRSSFTNGRHDLGYGFKGNHFLELHVVEDIFDTAVADQFDLKPEQVVILYHGGGGIVPYHIGRYYGLRRKGTGIQKLFQFIGKLFFHFASSKGLTHFFTRLRYYYFPDTFQEIPIESAEGTRLARALKASLNYSYAFNVAILRRVLDALADLQIGKRVEANLITAKIHNSIHTETIRGKQRVIHRHTVTQITDGAVSIVSGFNDTSSYLIVGGTGAEHFLSSADHGAGSVIKRKRADGNSQQHADRHTSTIHRTKKPHEEAVSHITDEGLREVVEKLERHDIAQRAIALRPLASFKG